MTHDQREAQHAVEGIILRRIYEKRLQGFTIETAKEIVETLTASPGEQKPQPAAGWNEAIEAAINVVKPWPGAEGLAQSEAEKAVENIRREFVKALEALRRAAPPPEGVDRPDAGDGVHLWHCNQGHYLNVCKYGDDDCPALSTSPAAAESNASVEARLREALDSIAHAVEMLSEHIEKFHDFDYAPHEVPLELADLRGIQHHLLGSLIDENGNAISAGGDEAVSNVMRSALKAKATVSSWSASKQEYANRAISGDEAKKSALSFKAAQNTAESDPSVTPDCLGADTGGRDSSSLPEGESDLSVTTGYLPPDPTAERREIVARIINPEVFAKYDAELAKDRRAENGKRWADVCYGEAIGRAFAKADAILAALDGGAGA